MLAEIDGFTARDLCDRYSIDRSNFYKRIGKLKELGYEVTPAKESGRAVYNLSQVNILDSLHDYLKTSGNKTANFPRIDTRVDSLVRQSHETQDTALTIARTQDISTPVLVELVTAIAHAIMPPVDPLAHLAQLERAAAHVWLLTTGEVKGLIGVAPTHGMRRHGFMFEKMGQPGRSVEWKVSKL